MGLFEVFENQVVVPMPLIESGLELLKFCNDIIKYLIV